MKIMIETKKKKNKIGILNDPVEINSHILFRAKLLWHLVVCYLNLNYGLITIR